MSNIELDIQKSIWNMDKIIKKLLCPNIKSMDRMNAKHKIDKTEIILDISKSTKDSKNNQRKVKMQIRIKKLN